MTEQASQMAVAKKVASEIWKSKRMKSNNNGKKFKKDIIQSL